MKFIEYLYFKYYNLGLKIGFKENASTSATLLMSLIFALYFLDMVIILDCVFGCNLLDSWVVGFFIISFICLLLIFDFTLVYFGRSSRIITKHKEKWMGKKHLGAILFPIIAFLGFILNCFLKMLITQGRI